MASLNSLVAAHGSVLVVDSASTVVHVGLLADGRTPSWWRSSREAGVAVFEGADAVLAGAAMRLDEIGALVFSHGPGSILGIRIAAMAFRTWKALAKRSLPAFGYCSLELLTLNLRHAGTTGPFAVIADARRGTWHFAEAAKTANGDHRPRRVSAAEIAAYQGALFTPSQFGVWARLPERVRTADYCPPDFWGELGAADLLHPAPEPEAFQYEEAAYALWTPRIHRAPNGTVAASP